MLIICNTELLANLGTHPSCTHRKHLADLVICRHGLAADGERVGSSVSRFDAIVSKPGLEEQPRLLRRAHRHLGVFTRA
jgi:hypothetical protein